MSTKRLQNRIAESRIALPITAVYALTVYMAAGLFRNDLWLPFISLGFSTYLMVELNNQNALLRVYSRMVSCVFLVFVSLAGRQLLSTEASVVLVSLAGYYLIVFNAYQNRSATAITFYAFLCIGIASTVFVQILFLVPVLWILHASKVLAMSYRTFWASVLGLVAPYWFTVGYYIYEDRMVDFITHFTALAQFQPPFEYPTVSCEQWLTVGYLAIVSLIGIGHYLRSSRNDKIRTRMIYEMFIVINLCILLFMALQPQHVNRLLPTLIVTSSPIVAHFITLTRTAFTNIVFSVIWMSAIILTVYNLWMQS